MKFRKFIVIFALLLVFHMLYPPGQNSSGRVSDAAVARAINGEAVNYEGRWRLEQSSSIESRTPDFPIQ